jgi:hypothetical protein
MLPVDELPPEEEPPPAEVPPTDVLLPETLPEKWLAIKLPVLPMDAAAEPAEVPLDVPPDVPPPHIPEPDCEVPVPLLADAPLDVE